MNDSFDDLDNEFPALDIGQPMRLERQITISKKGSEKENNRMLIDVTRELLHQAEKNGILGKNDADNIHQQIDELTKDKYNPNLSLKIANVLGKTFFGGSLFQSCKGQEFFSDKKDEPDNGSSAAMCVA